LQPLGCDEISVVELCARFLAHAQGYYVKDGRPTGAIAGFKAVIKYLRLWYCRDPASRFGPLALKALRQRMVDDGHSRRYVNDHVARIKQIFKRAVGEELVPAETHAALQRVTGLLRGRTTARETSPIGPVDDAVVEATLPYLPEVVADMVRLQRHTGMRPAEVCILRPCDLDRSGEVWLYRPSKPISIELRIVKTLQQLLGLGIRRRGGQFSGMTRFGLGQERPWEHARVKALPVLPSPTEHVPGAEGRSVFSK
jgi:integrase